MNLPTVCFLCGHYDHMKEMCPKQLNEQDETGVRTVSGKKVHIKNTKVNTKEAPNKISGYNP